MTINRHQSGRDKFLAAKRYLQEDGNGKMVTIANLTESPGKQAGDIVRSEGDDPDL